MAVNKDKAKKSFTIEVFLILIIILMLLFLCYLIGTPDLFSNQPHVETVSNIEVYIICKELVKSQLKAPSTAKFPNDWEITIGKLSSENAYRVLGYVDAQNSFGAMLRTNYTCDLQYLGGDWTEWNSWKILKIDFDE